MKDQILRTLDLVATPPTWLQTICPLPDPLVYLAWWIVEGLIGYAVIGWWGIAIGPAACALEYSAIDDAPVGRSAWPMLLVPVLFVVLILAALYALGAPSDGTIR